MRVVKQVLSVMSLVVMTACGTTGGVLQMGPDTYRISTSKYGNGSGPLAESTALQAAAAHCQALGRQLLVTNSRADFERPFHNYTATFKCLSEGDRDLHRPEYRSEPSVLIEDSRR